MADQVDSKVIPGRRLGWITEINRDRGFAFIRGIDGERYFAHAQNFTSSHWRKLAENDNVSFQAVDTIKGMRAARVQPATENEDGEVDSRKETSGNRL